VSETGEFELIGWVRERSKTGVGVLLGIGDDCAILRPSPGADLLVTTDMLMDGRHFRLDEAGGGAGAEAVGYKAMAVNLSDIAAMAGWPVSAVVAVALPKKNAVAIAHGLHAGLIRAAAPFGVGLVGGDTNAWDGPLVVNVTLIGQTVGRGPVRRSGARVGDLIFVTGPLGGSLRGRHLTPNPRITEAIALNAAVSIHGMIDISDGLAADLGHILEESGGLGAILEESAIPIHPDAQELSAIDGRSALEHALSDGEDFELCLTVAPADAEQLSSHPPSPAHLFLVGRIVEGGGLKIRSLDGEIRDVRTTGFDHLKA
jgi:thiamine-monophosphate kinase